MRALQAIEALRAHLGTVEPIFDAFCQSNGFTRATPSSIGRYPRIRVLRDGPVQLWIDLFMELDEAGRRFETFDPQLPYELSAGATAVVDEAGRTVRYSLITLRFAGRPFREVGAARAGLARCAGGHRDVGVARSGISR